MNTIDLEVQGMSCGACVKHVTQALQPLAGVSDVEVDLQSGHVRVTGDLSQGGDSLAHVLIAAGYPAKLSTSATSLATAIPQAKKSGGGCCCG